MYRIPWLVCVPAVLALGCGRVREDREATPTIPLIEESTPAATALLEEEIAKLTNQVREGRREMADARDREEARRRNLETSNRELQSRLEQLEAERRASSDELRRLSAELSAARSSRDPPKADAKPALESRPLWPEQIVDLLQNSQRLLLQAAQARETVLRSEADSTPADSPVDAPSQRHPAGPSVQRVNPALTCTRSGQATRRNGDARATSSSALALPAGWVTFFSVPWWLEATTRSISMAADCTSAFGPTTAPAASTMRSTRLSAEWVRRRT